MRPLLISLLLLCALLAVADAAGDCDQSFIKGADGQYEYISNVIKCKDANKEIMHEGTDRYPTLKCLSSGGWQGVVPTKGPQEVLNIQCVDKIPPVPACDQSLINGFKTGQMEYKSNKLTCIKPYQRLKYTDGVENDAHEIECPATGKWMADDDDTGIVNTHQITVSKCETVPCHEKLITKPDEASFASASLKCPSPKKLKIDSDTHLNDKITCDKTTGWTGLPKKEAQDQFTVSCVDPPEICTTTTDMTRDNENGVISVKCAAGANEHKSIKFGSDLYALLKCDSSGWKTDGGIVLQQDTTISLAVTCVDSPGCDAYQKPSGTDWVNGLTDDAEVTEVDGTKVFKCKNKEIGQDKNAITLNGKPVLSHLKCNAANGYTDIFGTTKLADAFEQVTIACVKSLCPVGHGGATCGIFDSRESLVKGYACNSDNSKDREPKKMTDDPNMLNCKTNKFARFYDTVEKTFHDYPLRCDTEGFYKYDDDKKVSKVSDPSKVLCLEYTCATCPKLLKGTTDGVELDTTSETRLFTEGTPIKCANATCAKNLWSVKKAGSTTNDEYAGDVTCSSEADTNGVASKKWLIDGETEIIEGSCIDSVASCRSAVMLTTTCDGAWTGCVPVTLDDNAPVKCTEPKLMFYMQKGDYGFLDGATEIKCDKDKGVWKVTKNGGAEDELRRGGTVICANQNPAPTTTTLAPTTTTPFVKACDVCPKIETVLMKCDDCSNRADHIKFLTQGEICEAFPEEYSHATTLKTDKGGTVDKLYCNKTFKKWTTKDGLEVGKFAAFVAAPVDEETSLLIIVGGAAGGVLILIIIFAVIFKVCIFRKKRPVDKDEETKKKMLEAKKKKKLGDNDDILDQVSVDVPSELKL